MKLKNWLRKSEMTHEQFAEIIGVSRPTISDWVNEKIFPNQEHRELITEVTDGKVKSKDFKYPAAKIVNKKIDDIKNVSRTTRWRNRKRGWGISNYRKRS